MDILESDETPVIEPQAKIPGDGICEVEGCREPWAPGQNHVCAAHQRSS